VLSIKVLKNLDWRSPLIDASFKVTRKPPYKRNGKVKTLWRLCEAGMEKNFEFEKGTSSLLHERTESEIIKVDTSSGRERPAVNIDEQLLLPLGAAGGASPKRPD